MVSRGTLPRARRRAASTAATAAGLAGALASPGLACSVCFGAADDPMLDGTRLSVVFLLGLTYLLLGGVAGMFVLSRRHHRRAPQTAEPTATHEGADAP